MAITLPTGWTNFGGGGSDADLCGEDQTCPEPPCGPVPPIIVTPGPGEPVELSCVLGQDEITLVLTGGTPPFIWAALGGEITVTGLREATISIAPEDLLTTQAIKVGRIAFFKPFIIAHFLENAGDHQMCDAHGANSNLVNAVVDVRLKAYDCLKRYIPINGTGNTTDNVAPDFDDPGDLMDNPIGDNVADRTCVLAQDWPVSGIGAQPTPSDPTHWSVSNFGCLPSSGDCGNVSVQTTTTTAGKNAVHGTVWSGAPATNETKNLTCGGSGELNTHEQYIDVRTQEQVDTECCTVPAGSDVTVTVVDAENNVAILVIPVVEPL